MFGFGILVRENSHKVGVRGISLEILCKNIFSLPYHTGKKQTFFFVSFKEKKD